MTFCGTARHAAGMLSPAVSRRMQALALAALVFEVTLTYLRLDVRLLFVLVRGFLVTAALAVALPADSLLRTFLKRDAPHLKTT